MKNSLFNTSFLYNGKWVLYNALSDNFILLEPLVYDLYKLASIENKICKIKKHHTELYDILLENNVILKQDIDEVGLVKSISSKIDSNDENFHLTINPTMSCNFKCWYCYENHVAKSKLEDINLKRIKALIDKKTNSGIKSLTISWFGGEPLLYYKKNVLPILKYTFEKCQSRNIKLYCTFTTNGFLINDRMIQDFKKYGVNGFQITLDGNKQEHDKVRYTSNNKGSYDKILSNIFKLCNNDLFVSLRINYTKHKLYAINDIYSDLLAIPVSKRKNLKVDFQRVWQTEDDIKSREQILQFMSKFSNEKFKVSSIISNVDYVKNSCYADKKNHATINYDGNVFKCTARKFDSKNREGVLKEDGIIEWNQRYYDRLNAKFKNKPCLSCRLLPICNGGCSQQALEHTGDYCMYDFDEERKTEVVKNKFLLILNNIDVD